MKLKERIEDLRNIFSSKDLLDLLSVLRGFRRVAKVTIHPPTSENITRFVRFMREIHTLDIVQYWYNGSYLIFHHSKRQQVLDFIKKYPNPMNSKEGEYYFGLLVGYPKCCVKAHIIENITPLDLDTYIPFSPHDRACASSWIKNYKKILNEFKIDIDSNINLVELLESKWEKLIESLPRASSDSINKSRTEIFKIIEELNRIKNEVNKINQHTLFQPTSHRSIAKQLKKELLKIKKDVNAQHFVARNISSNAEVLKLINNYYREILNYIDRTLLDVNQVILNTNKLYRMLFKIKRHADYKFVNSLK
ncbi:hypothetical protein HN924_02835 [Candidatus Woesearchaeota archaeon]|jgi:hypothetical protein|nr:hypothetical protein [Candidatus Woesearchaeota archaeon]MBT7062878.1 hypothetical protein [Candidatus Woesearchaeota archaeon]MBT7402716.1 hypothetical protein [Candidatus Woesearchaeota archaeon]